MEFKFYGPEDGDTGSLDALQIESIAKDIKDQWERSGHVTYSYIPQNGTYYNLLFTSFRGSTVVAWMNIGTISHFNVFSPGNPFVWDYIAENLECGQSDAMVLANLFNSIRSLYG